jgi:signal transduction histidine kinase
MPPTSSPNTERPLVLYVDDELSNRVVFEQSFGREFDVVTVADGAAALALLETREAAVLLTDMQMPELSGEELLRIAKERHPRTIRVVVTAYSDIDRILRALNEGLVARYIIKPWERTEIVQVLRWACEAWSLSADAAQLHHRLVETERLVTTASTLVHDLKTPLMTILSNAQHLEDLSTDVPQLRAALAELPLAARHRRLLDLILDDLKPISEELVSATERLDEMIERLHPFPDAVPGVTPSIDPLPIVRHVMAVCQPLASQLSASIAYDGPGALPRVRMSATELSQVLINVVANGAQAISARGTGHGRVSISAHEHEGMLELKVHDDGVGIAANDVARVGTPFYTTREDGAGLGVAQCQRLVGTAGGRFQIESEPGNGTTVTILLPTAA